jgi:A/G-specific adenine glycosylase
VLHPVIGWYRSNARDLPWRRPGTTPWGVLVSEVMLQQTPAQRVAPVYDAWLSRWPTPGALAEEPAGEAVRAWGRLGYPGRALRLHAAAGVIDCEHDGVVPCDPAVLRSLPGVGEYTAAAVAAFAYGAAVAVLDTNVRRVQARWRDGVAIAAGSITNAERRRAVALLPATGAAEFSVALMELGALVCTADRPDCTGCPLAADCAWLSAGRPAWDGPPRRAQAWAGTDRQVRGRLLALLREADGPLSDDELATAWDEPVQRTRCLQSLVSDGLAEPVTGGYRLPG